jgi:ubiquinone biosynthesis protein
MKETNHIALSVHRVMVATDRSETADNAVRWAANLAAGFQAELLLFQVLLPGNLEETGPDVVEVICNRAHQELMRFSEEIAGFRGRAKVVIDADPVAAILEAIEAEAVDVIVLGNVGMSGRKQFLLGNVPNRISHNAIGELGKGRVPTGEHRAANLRFLPMYAWQAFMTWFFYR